MNINHEKKSVNVIIFYLIIVAFLIYLMMKISYLLSNEYQSDLNSVFKNDTTILERLLILSEEDKKIKVNNPNSIEKVIYYGIMKHYNIK